MRSTIYVLMMLLLAACGDSGGSDGDERPDPPPATATATPSATPEPSATPTPAPAFDEILLGVGARYGRELPNGGRAYTALVLRNAGAGWEEIKPLLPERAFVTGVSFATAEVAFLYGGRDESTDGILLRSDTAGQSWINVSSALPPDCQAIADLAFVDRQNGYLVSHGYFSTAYFATEDGGLTWRPVDVPFSVGMGGSYAAGTRDLAAEVVRYESAGLSVVRLDDPTALPLALAPSGGTFIGGANAFSTVGAHGWIAAAAPTRPNDSFHNRAAIFTSSAPGAAWVEQLVDPSSGYPQLRAIDVRDDHNGVAGGFTVAASEDAYLPFAIVLDPDGTSWHQAPITGIPDGWSVFDVLRTRGDGAWATATDITTAVESAFLRSDDGGRSWHREPSSFEQDVQIFDLARNTAAH